jgi:uncharacterized membrane protein
MGQDNSTTGLKVVGGIVGFLIPLVGLILFFVWKKNKPSAAKVALIAAVIGFVLNIIIMATNGTFTG